MGKKIIIAFGCGLGNQMFEYAFYKAMKSRFLEYSFFIDKRLMLPQQHNGYELDKVFGIQLPECSKRDYWGYLRYVYFRSKWAFPINVVAYFIRKFWTNDSYYRQPNNTEYYDEVFEAKDKNRYFFRGIWANEKYFLDNRDEILSDFEFVNSLDEKNLKIAEKIANSQSVSIHIRRGDYVTGSFNLLGNDYYKKAVEYIENQIKSDIHYFVFSDDTLAAEELMQNLTMNEMTIVSGNDGVDSWKDMKLMSLCKHNIIANSSFSFWGAYLNSNIDKTVIYSKMPMSNSVKPFGCDSWIEI